MKDEKTKKKPPDVHIAYLYLDGNINAYDECGHHVECWEGNDPRTWECLARDTKASLYKQTPIRKDGTYTFDPVRVVAKEEDEP